MDKKQLELAKASLKIYLEIIIKDELVNIVKNTPDVKLVSAETLVERISARLRVEEKAITQIIWKQVMKQMAELMKEAK